LPGLWLAPEKSFSPPLSKMPFAFYRALLAQAMRRRKSSLRVGSLLEAGLALSLMLALREGWRASPRAAALFFSLDGTSPRRAIPFEPNTNRCAMFDGAGVCLLRALLSR